jgi:hypothetical protein
MSAMTPVALVAYQSGLTVPVTAQEPPDDVTGAAGALGGGWTGALDGGWVGGARWCPDDVDAGELVRGAGDRVVGAWLAAGCPGDDVLA